MDSTALRVEGIRMSLEATRWIADLEARRHIAVLAVALTLTGTSGLAGIAGQLPPPWAVFLAAVGLAIAATQLRALAYLKVAVRRNAEDARAAVDKLITRQEEHHVDETPGHP